MGILTGVGDIPPTHGLLTLTLALLVVTGAALLGGISGFGFALISTPLLLALGFPLAFVVPTNLMIAMLTRFVVAYRLREHIRYGRVAVMAAASLPGIGLGLISLALFPAHAIKLATGLLVMVATLLIWRTASLPPRRPWPGAVAVAGCLGGLLGVTTSLNGVPPVLLLASEQTTPKRFQADLALFFVLTNIATLLLLGWRGRLPEVATLPLALFWLAIALIANQVGTSLGGRLSTVVFRRIAMGLAFCAGIMTVVTA
jgi:uncharacterized membrane protein YfcA